MVSAGLSSLGSIFIFMLLARRGPIFLALVTTTRKVFTVLLSVYTSNASLVQTEVVGIIIVIGGLVLEGLSALFSKKPDNGKASPTGSLPQNSGPNSPADFGVELGRDKGSKKLK